MLEILFDQNCYLVRWRTQCTAVQPSDAPVGYCDISWCYMTWYISFDIYHMIYITWYIYIYIYITWYISLDIYHVIYHMIYVSWYMTRDIYRVIYLTWYMSRDISHIITRDHNNEYLYLACFIVHNKADYYYMIYIQSTMSQG